MRLVEARLIGMKSSSGSTYILDDVYITIKRLPTDTGSHSQYNYTVSGKGQGKAKKSSLGNG